MNNDLLLGVSNLGKGKIRRVARPLGRRVECVSGVLWVTQDGDRRDIILEPGDAFDFDRSEGVLISALQDSRYLLLDGGRTHH
ncbi:MAG TPA: DUF2917 domain-containing protein [Caldimonas sp.]|jgi:hypothetical protein|nr:DUF2917 domain-containing protein [Caldimonas sp.]HEX2540077.1 DUF2917 domain-containing protein [Caldimonas sp.]